MPAGQYAARARESGEDQSTGRPPVLFDTADLCSGKTAHHSGYTARFLAWRPGQGGTGGAPHPGHPLLACALEACFFRAWELLKPRWQMRHTHSAAGAMSSGPVGATAVRVAKRSGTEALTELRPEGGGSACELSMSYTSAPRRV